jgi:hypothetical protein
MIEGMSEENYLNSKNMSKYNGKKPATGAQDLINTAAPTPLMSATIFNIMCKP